MLDAALAAGGVLDPLAEGAEVRVAGWLAGSEGGAGGVAELIITSPDPDDLTLRAARLLGSADLVAFEPGVPPAILDRARADAVRLAIAAGEAAPQRAGPVVVLRA